MRKKILFENENWLCVQPLDFETSKHFAKEARWCTSNFESFFNYYKRKSLLVYCINKKNENIKYGIGIFKGGNYEFLDAKGYRHYPVDIPDMYIPRNLLKKTKTLPLYILKKLFKLKKIKIK